MIDVIPIGTGLAHFTNDPKRMMSVVLAVACLVLLQAMIARTLPAFVGPSISRQPFANPHTAALGKPYRLALPVSSELSKLSQRCDRVCADAPHHFCEQVMGCLQHP